MERKCTKKILFSLISAILTIVCLIPTVFGVVTNAAEPDENWLPAKYTYTKDELLEKNALYERLEKLDQKQIKKEKTKKTVDTTKEVLKEANKMASAIITTIDEMQTADDFDTAALVNGLFSVASGVANVCPGWGPVVGASLDVLNTVYNAVMGGQDAPSASALMEDRLNQRLDEMADQISDLEEQIGEISNQINDQTNAILAGVSDSLDSAEAKAKLAEFMLCTGTDDFGYNQYRNYMYGLTKNNSNGATAYYNLLLHAQTSGASEEVLKSYYDALYNELYDNRDVFRDYVIGAKSGKSIVQYYYDVVSARPDLLDEGVSPETATIRFAYDLYQTQLMSDQLMLMCNNYQYVQMLLNDTEIYWFGDETKDFVWKTQIEGDEAVDAMYKMMADREDELIDQFAKDMVYVLQINKTYIVKQSNGQPCTLNTEDVDGTIYAKALVGQTVCLNRVPTYVCDLFEIDASDYEYEGEGVYTSDGLFVYSSNSNRIVCLKYKGEVVESITFSDGASGEFAGGDGTASNPYLICNAKQFLNINNGLDKYYKLVSDIDFEKDGVSMMRPIGWHRNSVGTDVYDAFEGVLNGNGYSIKNISISSGDYNAVFGKIGESGAIKNVTFDNVVVEATIDVAENQVSTFYFAFVAATNDGLIKNCSITNSTLSVTGNTTNEGVNRTVNYKAGGVAGVNAGAIAFVETKNCTLSVESTHDFAGAATKQNMNFVYVGGITGDNCGYIGYVVVNKDVDIVSNANSICDQKTSVAPYVTAKAGGVAASNSSAESYFKALYSDADVSSEAKAESNSLYSIYKKNIKSERSDYIIGFSESKLETICEEKADVLSAFPVENGWAVEFKDDKVYDVSEPQLHKDSILTINGVVTEYSVLAVYGFDTYNDSEKYMQTRNVTLLLGVMIDGDYTMIWIDSNITVGKDYVSSIELPNFKTEYIKGEKLPSTYNILQYYASGEGKCVPVIDANISIDDASVINTIGTHVITISYNGISCQKEITVVCPYHNYYENKKQYNKVKEVAPTCESIGYEEFECQECGEAIQTNFKAKIDHCYTKEVSKDASCKEEGVIGQVLCPMCDTIFEQEVAIPKLSHVVIGYGDKNAPPDQLPNEESHYCKSGGHWIAHDYTVSESVVDGVLIYTYTCTECKYVNKIADTNIITNAEKMQPAVIVSDGYALKGGDVVTVYVSLVNNPGVTGAHFGVRYDERLTFLDEWSEGTLFTQSLASDSAPVNCGYNFIWGNSDTRSYDGTLLVLKFRLPEDATETDRYSVSVVYTSNNGTIEGFSIDSKVLNAYNLENGTNLTTSDPVRFITRNGTIRLVDHLPGDVNCDNVVDVLDALYLSHTIVYEKQTAEVNKHGDVNLSGGNANVNDVVDILQSLTGAHGTNLLYHEYELVINSNGYVTIPSTNLVQLYGENCTYDKILTSEIINLMKHREGYKFLGWYTRLENGTEIKLNDVIKYDSNQKIQTVYARWEKNEVSFDINGATSGEIEGLKYGGSDRYITLTAPEEKYTITFADPNNLKNSKTSIMSRKFSHWALLNENGAEIRIYNVGDKFDINEANLGKVTLKAIWVQNDGWLLNIPTLDKSGYDSTKIDWYTDVFCSDEIDVGDFEAIKALGNKVLYADWTTPITYKVTYDLGNGAIDTVTVKYGDYVHIPIPFKEGYTFNGWTISGAEGISSSDATKEDFLNLRSTSGTVVMSAKFTKNSYKVHITLNEGKLDGVSSLITCNYGDSVNIPNPTREGYIFAGWKIVGMDEIVHTYGSSTTSATSLSEIMATTFKNLRGTAGDVTFTAYWKVDIKTIGATLSGRNGVVVSDTDGTNTYTVYTTINGTGWSPSASNGRVIVYWGDEPGTTIDMLEYKDRIGAPKDRLNNIDIGSGTKEIVFVGNPKKTYVNLCMHLCNFANHRKLTIRFVDFNFKTNYSFAIQQWNGETDPDIDLTIDVIGDCSIGTEHSGGNILNFPDQSLTFTGSGTLDITAGDGADGATAGASGGDGGVAINAGHVIVDMTGKLIATGGDGGNGYEGDTGSTGSTGSRRDLMFGKAGNGGTGGTGGAGGNGGAGGAAIIANKVIIVNGTVVCEGGDGGDGGKGGTGGTGGHGGCSNSWGTEGGDGGKGGTGGKGGNGRYGSIAVNCSDVTISSSGSLSQEDGANGKVGGAGDGGTGGDPGYYDGAGWDSGEARKGEPGSPGDPGSLGSLV